jgi:ankyrin repeat protein
MNRELYQAIGENDIDRVRILLQNPEVDPTADNNEALRYSSWKGHYEIVQLLLQDPRIDPSAHQNQALINAAVAGRTNIVELLLQDPRVNPSDSKNAAIELASTNGHIDIVRLLLQNPRFTPTGNFNRAIYSAISKGYKDIVLLFAEYPGALISIVNYNLRLNNWTSLWKLPMMTGAFSDSREDVMVWSAAIGSLPLLQYLINNGADPHYDNDSALASARHYNHPEIVDYLSRI